MRINLLKSLPKVERDVKARLIAKTPEIIAEASKFGKMYFDGPREYGYGGYEYDGRWVPVAKDIVSYYQLKPGMKVLDIGCAKGFLVKDLSNALPGLDVLGIDISEYAIKNCDDSVVDKVRLGDVRKLPFSGSTFDLVLSINVLHNFDRQDLIKALKEIVRVGRSKAFIQVDAYESSEQKSNFEDWVLTAKFYGYPEDWYEIFKEAGYTGDYDWTIV
ncbi:MAG: class I SAM-dependent methyltransferase [Holosporales bacterium]|jgi:SAM-dependent methyltransferase|nr:class I SAM-dependent methyltransferase [Holosporales bacterium]